MSEFIPETQNVSNRQTRIIAIVGAIIFLLILLAAAFLFLDPFGWNLLGLKPADPIAEAMPADIALYLRADLRNINNEHLNRIVWAFDEDLKEEQTDTFDKLYEEFDNILLDSLGLTMTDDLIPWLGGGVGLGVDKFGLNMFGDLEDMEFILAIESRNNAAAEEFLLKFRNAIAEESGEQFLEKSYQGATIHVLDTLDDYERIVVTLSGDLVLISQSESSINDAIDAQSAESLADSASYNDLIGQLPSGRALTFYVNGEKYGDLMAGMMEGLYGFFPTELGAETLGMMQGIAAGISIQDIGVRMDASVSYNQDVLSDEMREYISYVGVEPQIASLLPEDTFVYFSGQRFDLYWENLKKTLETLQGGEDFDESMEMLEISVGFNPDTDLFPRLDGEWGIGVMASSEGILAEEADVLLGFAFVAGTSDPGGIRDIAVDFNSTLERQGLAEVETTQEGPVVLYELLDMFSGDRIIAYGVSEEHLAIGSSAAAISEIFVQGPSLAESEPYREVWQAFPKDMAPVFYVDFRGLIGQIKENMSAEERESFDEDAGRVWKPITFLAMANAPLEGSISKGAMILFIETE